MTIRTARMRAGGSAWSLSKASPVALVATTGALLVFGLLAVQIRKGRSPAWDERGLRLLSPHESAPAVGWVLTRAADIVGEYRGLWSAGVFILGLLAARRVRTALGFALVLAGTLATAAFLKPHFTRPSLIDGRHGYFPSTHSAGAMALGIAVAVVAWKTRWRWPVLGLCGVTVVVYGAALVYTRDHYPSDIVCGWCIAVGWTGAVALAARLGRRLPRLPRWRGRAPTRSAR